MFNFLRRFFGGRPLREVFVFVCASGGEDCNATLRIHYTDDGTPEFYEVYECLPEVIEAVWNLLGIDVEEECDIEHERGGNDWYFHWEGNVLR